VNGRGLLIALRALSVDCLRRCRLSAVRVLLVIANAEGNQPTTDNAEGN
jgi:hypothetical protein